MTYQEAILTGQREIEASGDSDCCVVMATRPSRRDSGLVANECIGHGLLWLRGAVFVGEIPETAERISEEEMAEDDWEWLVYSL